MNALEVMDLTLQKTIAGLLKISISTAN